MNLTPENVTAYVAALTALLTAITTLVLTLRNGTKTTEIHAMVKADASPAALDVVKGIVPPAPAPKGPAAP